MKAQTTCVHPTTHYSSSHHAHPTGVGCHTYTTSPRSAKTRAGSRGEANKEHAKSKRTRLKQVMNYKHCQFQCFQRCPPVLLFSFKTAENSVIKRNVKIKTQKEKQHSKGSALREKTRSFETHLQEALPKIICTNLLCTTRNIEINSTLQHLISQLPEMSYKPFRSNTPFPQGATERMPRSKRTARRLRAAHKTAPPRGHARFILLS